MVVSRSEAVINSLSSVNSNKNSSRIGKVALELSTPLNAERFFSSNELDTINFILLSGLNITLKGVKLIKKEVI
jgi:hypothetical protein